jgi:hypothetical protein
MDLTISNHDTFGHKVGDCSFAGPISLKLSVLISSPYRRKSSPRFRKPAGTGLMKVNGYAEFHGFAD